MNFDAAVIKNMAKTIRKHIITMTYEAGDQGGHVSSALSMAEIMAALYFGVMSYDVKVPEWPDRDRFVLSKGHGVLGYYPALAEAGFFPTGMLKTFEKKDSYLGGHPCSKMVPGIDVSSGSMGQGLPIGLGMAKAAAMDKKGYYVYVLIGDGELNEGSVWEAVMLAAQLKMDNLVAIIDKNGLQHDGFNSDIIDTDPLACRFESFGWDVTECDGHDVGQLLEAFDHVKSVKSKPHVIIAGTIKGKGVSFIENKVEWHHALINAEQAEKALAEIDNAV